ncbi:MAG TPA: glycosyltransferase family 2 protein [Terriglobales bacterium]|nr:glycosyltransferase family 2 protein [Terriglobales bacterium]
MSYAFWASFALIIYAYLGYPLLLWLISKLRRKPVAKTTIEPTVSIVMAVRNESTRLANKLRNLKELDYPSARVEIVVVSDGSTDDTNELLRASTGIKALFRTSSEGKAAALRAAIPFAKGEILLFTDVRQEIERSALRALVSNFGDPEVGCVSGELLFRSRSEGAAESGVSLYWRLEKLIRKLEAASGSVVGATGALYAARRSLVPEIPAGTLLDDVYIPMAISRGGYRVVFEPAARAWDEEPKPGKGEFQRKVRTLAGNYQLLQLAPWLLSSSNRLWFRFVSHKLLRLAIPFLLAVLFIASLAAWNENLYRAFAMAQAVFYALAFIGLAGWHRGRVISAAASFCLLNAAAAAALISFLRHKRSPTRLWSAQPSTIPFSDGGDFGQQRFDATGVNISSARNSQ